MRRLLIAAVFVTFASAAGAAGGPGTNGRILYTEQMDKALSGTLYASGADGSGRVLLAEDALNGTWSPDGKRVVFESYRKGDGDLWTVDADATHLQELTFSSAYDGDPSWSPDGTRIAFESNRSNATGADVFAMDADGNNVTRLTANGGFNGDPAWSPDGSTIAFTSDRGGSKDIWLMNADGTGLVQLTNAPGIDENPAWSPDGSQIAFDGDRTAPRNLDVWVMNADGSNQHALAASDRIDALPSWSPDGTQVAFASVRTNQSLIYTVRPDGSNVKLVSAVTAAHNATLPSWGIRPAGDVCTIEGTVNADWLVGTSGRDVMCGGGKGLSDDDTFRAGAGDDLILAPNGLNDVDGGPGNDVIHSCGFIEGGPGNDRIYAATGGCGGALDGGAGNDVIIAGPRQDEIWGGSGRDVLRAGGGDDTIHARDGQRDIVDGGPGRDVAEVDKIDVVRNVEVIRYPSANSKPGAVQVVSN